MVTSYSRGHQIYLDKESNWRYSDNDDLFNIKGSDIFYERQCKKCGCLPNEDGSDHCLGYIKGATSACCGHGVEKPYVILTREKNNPFYGEE